MAARVLASGDDTSNSSSRRLIVLALISSIIAFHGKHNRWLLRFPGLPPDLSSDQEREGMLILGEGLSVVRPDTFHLDRGLPHGPRRCQ